MAEGALSSLSDEELIQAFRATQDPRALDPLVERHAGALRRVLYRLVLNHADADDLTQEAFLRAFRGLAGYRGDARFSTWLHRIGVNVANTFLLRQARSPHVLVDPPAHACDTASRQPDRQRVSQEGEGAIAAALAELSPQLRTAIVLVSLEGLPIPEAARRAGCQLATFYWRLHRARKLLKKRLAGSP